MTSKSLFDTIFDYKLDMSQNENSNDFSYLRVAHVMQY